MTGLLEVHRLTTDADYALALDELEQLLDVPEPKRSVRARELAALISEYEARVANVLAQAVRTRALRR